ncbi:hypothetical protein OIU76_002241 [Salix suchowensis]|nr:hypothetical protein OIU76_002241 [Salix suchowensis]
MTLLLSLVAVQSRSTLLQSSQSRKMCYKVTCSTCGKSIWRGCGGHALSVYRGIPEGHRCLCREWPGVAPKNPNGNGAGSFSSCRNHSV